MKFILTTLSMVAVMLCTTVAQANIVNFSATIDQSQEVPPTGSAGTGFATITFDDVTSQLDWNISFSGLTGPATGIHFHNEAFGNNGSVVINVGVISGLTSPTIGSTVISPALTTELFMQRLYINIHTDAFPGGEIRGQVVPEPVSTTLLGGLAGVVMLRRRRV